MSEPIKSKASDILEAPTPQNTPASNSGSLVNKLSAPKVPTTISEESEDYATAKQLTNNPLIMSMIEGKLNNLVGQSSGYVGSLPKAIKNRIISLKTIQKKQMDLEMEFQRELFELEKKYNTLGKPLNEHRKRIIVGEVEPTEEEIEEGQAIEAELEGDEEEVEDEDEDDVEKGEEGKDAVKGIPAFWLTALNNLSPINETITDRDSEVLSSLTDIRVEHLDKPGFKLIFEFAENDFFKKKFLEKTYYYQEELGYTGEFIYDHAEGCEIDWKSPEQNVTIKIERRKQRNKHTKQIRTIEKLTPTESFFNFFDPPTPPSFNEEDEDAEEDDDDEDEDLESRLQLDYHIAEEIKDKLVPRAVDWFTGVAAEFIDYEDQDYFDDEDFDDEDDEDEEEEDDDDDDDEDGAKQKEPQECKQQ